MKVFQVFLRLCSFLLRLFTVRPPAPRQSASARPDAAEHHDNVSLSAPLRVITHSCSAKNKNESYLALINRQTSSEALLFFFSSFLAELFGAESAEQRAKVSGIRASEQDRHIAKHWRKSKTVAKNKFEGALTLGSCHSASRPNVKTKRKRCQKGRPRAKPYMKESASRLFCFPTEQTEKYPFLLFCAFSLAFSRLLLFGAASPAG